MLFIIPESTDPVVLDTLVKKEKELAKEQGISVNELLEGEATDPTGILGLSIANSVGDYTTLSFEALTNYKLPTINNIYRNMRVSASKDGVVCLSYSDK